MDGGGGRGGSGVGRGRGLRTTGTIRSSEVSGVGIHWRKIARYRKNGLRGISKVRGHKFDEAARWDFILLDDDAPDPSSVAAVTALLS